MPDYWGNNYVDDVNFHNGEPIRCEGYCTDVFFDTALAFIESHRDAPFFAYLAPNAMHAPHIVPEEYAKPYMEQGIPEERAQVLRHDRQFRREHGSPVSQSETTRISTENTLVIFTADHGTASGYDPYTGDGYNAGLRGKKGSVYDGGHQVNFFIRWSGRLPAERKVSQLTAHFDILPTLIDICGLNIGSENLQFDGLSLADALLGKGGELPERSLVIQLQPDQPRKWHQTALLNGHWRLVNGAELYDVESDRAQEFDVAAEFPQVVSSLRRDYDAFWEAMQDSFSQVIAIPVGAERENPALLSARDWHPTEGRVPWRQSWIDDTAYDANGFWWIDVTRPGPYRFELRTHPREAERPMRVSAASLQVDDEKWSKVAAENDCHATFDLGLDSGVYELRTELSNIGGDRRRGAYYVYVTKV